MSKNTATTAAIASVAAPSTPAAAPAPATPPGTPIASKPAVVPPPAAGASIPTTTTRQAAPPVHPAATPVTETSTSADRVAAARAKLEGADRPGESVVKDGERPKSDTGNTAKPADLTQRAGGTDVPASTEAKGSEIDVAAATKEAQAAAAAEAAVILPPDADLTDKAKRARALADKGDHVGALKEMGIDLEAAVKQKTSAPKDEDPKAKELADLKAENERLKAEREQHVAKAAAQAQHNAIVERVIADPDYANLTTPTQVDAAFAEARAVAAVLAAKHKRALTEAESDRLVRHVLAEHDKAAAGNSAEKRETPPTIKGARAGADSSSKPRHRTAEEVRRTAFQPPTRN